VPSSHDSERIVLQRWGLSLLLIGLCSLVEARLYELAESQSSDFSLSDIKGQGVSRLKRYLSRLGVLDFGQMKDWNQFMWLYKLRNSLVHSYGGLVLVDQTEDVKSAFKNLGFQGGLVGGRRIRLRREHLEHALEIVESLLHQIDRRVWDEAKAAEGIAGR